MDGKIMKYLACNIKNKMTKEETLQYIEGLNDISNDEEKLIIIPPYPFLGFYKEGKYKLGSQDISSFAEETITGEVTAPQLKSLGVTYCIIGHSERRNFKKEINIDFINKINHAQEEDIKVIYCVGETLEEKENGDTFIVLEKQISEVLNNIEVKDIMIAYEPIWAIGTGKIPEKREIMNTIEFIKEIVEENYEYNIKVLYGGSVNVDNIKDINNISIVDGFLVGGASLKAENVKQMLEVIKE
ncbi:MAG: triose-phosphate isomerase [Bacilli bacterium]|nr:triose-phosphate isomerase [Bacilli bacterium]